MTDGTWRNSPAHRDWLKQQAKQILDFYDPRAINPGGGFSDLDENGQPFGDVRALHSTTRMVHCFAIAQLLQRPGAADIVDHGMQYIWKKHRDTRFGGYIWSLGDSGPLDVTKQAYGHAFVLLAAASAKCVGHPLADKLLADVTDVINHKFWEPVPGAVSEEYAQDWSPISTYRGQNSNMHMTEALMAAFEATGEKDYLHKAKSIAGHIIRHHAAAHDYSVAEHFRADWTLDLDYKGSDMFRPAGTTPGHWLEWARLLLQLWALDGKQEAWLPQASARLFKAAVERGWDKDKGGFFYTLDWNNVPALRQKLWWPATEGIGAAAFLAATTKEPFYDEWYERIWRFCDAHFIDHAKGSWFHELGDDLKPITCFFNGKPDIYHALQCCLIPLYPAEASLTRVITNA